jgi:hypothetical protein
MALPGRLTVAHIEAAKARGEDVIIYRHNVYTIKELEDLAGIRHERLSTESEEDQELDRRSNYGRIGKSGRQRDNAHKNETDTPESEIVGPRDSEATPS